MNEYTLIRTESTPDGVFGRMGALYTLEEEDLGNQRSISCIPEGRYVCRRTIYHKHNIPTFEVTGVPGRTRILFHPGNTEEDSMGCILLGLTRGELRVRDEDTKSVVKKLAVLSSKRAFEKFMRLHAGEDAFLLSIERAY